MKKIVIDLVPKSLRVILRKVLMVKRLLFFKAPQFYCHVCNANVKGVLVGFFPSPVLACLNCLSLSRQRMVARFFNEQKLQNKNILHFAPEESLKNKILSLQPNKYVSADIDGDKYGGMDCINIENINYEDNSYDYIVANHILEHVDHNLALKELFRILKKGGRLFLTFPIVYSWKKNYQNEFIKNHRERELHFGQSDHLRIYGREIEDIMKALFNVSSIIASGSDHVEFGMDRGEILYILEKPLKS